MKFNCLVFVLLSWISISFAQNYPYPEAPTHHLGIGPYAGYESFVKVAVYGIGSQYEFRAFPRLGFTLGATYDYSPYTKFDMGLTDYEKTLLGISDQMEEVNIQQGQLAVNGGARFYMKRFYISAGIGWSSVHYTLRGEESGDQESDTMNRFYHCYGVGYQLPLQKGQLEPFFNATTGGVPKTGGTPKVTVGVRYAFQLK